MADKKQYINQPQENGCVMISEDVIESIAKLALAEIEGFDGLSNKNGVDLVDIVGKNRFTSGISVTVTEDNKLFIDCNILVAYGSNVMNVAKTIQRAICSAVESATGNKVDGVNVNVSGIIRK